ncbi:cutinase family protein [Intrasporangium mesophilum]
MYYPWVGYVPPPRPAPADPQPVPPDNSTKCSQLVVLGARGSSEDPMATRSGLFGPWIAPTFSGESDGFGTNSWAVYQELKDALAISDPQVTVKPVAVQYLGLSVPGFVFRGQWVGPEGYMQSIFDGEDKLLARMHTELRDCPNSKFVLLGYSQGALAIHLSLRLMASSEPSLLERVVGVGLIADPGRVAFGSELLWESANTEAGILVRPFTGVWTSGLWYDSTLAGAIPNTVTGRTISLCHQLDPVCGASIGGQVLAHLNYSPAETQAVGQWLAQRLHAGGIG